MAAPLFDPRPDDASTLRSARGADAEQSVVAAMMGFPACIPRVAAILSAADFGVADHRLLFAAMVRLSEAGKAVDPLTVAEELEAHDHLEAAGGKEYIGFLVDALPTADNAESYARLVLDYAQRRAADDVLLRSREAIADRSVPLPSVLDDVASRFSRLSGTIAASDARSYFLTGDEVKRRPSPRFLVDGIIPHGGLALLYGPPGVGKSFFSLALALDVAAGRPFLGRAVDRGTVVYIAAGEGTAGLGVRIAGWEADRGRDVPGDAHFRTEAVSLVTPASVSAFIAALRTLDVPPVLVVVDTLARCILPGDENATVDMGKAVAALDEIRRATGGAVLGVHHPLKGGDAERGSGALRGACDAIFTMKGAAGSPRKTVACEKMKDAPETVPFAVALRSAGGSLAICPEHSADISPELPTEEHRKLIRALALFRAEGSAPSGQWREASNVEKTRFHELRSDLHRWGYVQAERKGQTMRYSLTEGGALLLADMSATSPGLVRRTSPQLVRSRAPSLVERGERTGTDVIGGPG